MARTGLPPLNILLVTVDQLRGDLGGIRGHTPNLDALAAAGTRFTSHFVQAYPCGPARAGLVTGLYAHKHRVVSNGTPLDAAHPTLFTELRAAGYRPTLFGYTDTTPDPRGRPPGDPDLGEYEGVCRGLDVDTLLIERSTAWLAHLKGRGYPVPDPDAGREGIFAQRPFPAPAVFAAEDSETAFLTDRFLAWLSVAGRVPFCAHLSYVAPHPPFAAAAPWHALVDPADVPSPLRGADPDVEGAQHPLVPALLERMEMADFAPGLSGPALTADERTIRALRAIYAGQMAEVDHHLGRVFAALKASGRWDDTLIVFTADHGEQLFDHWMLGKAGFYDQSAHVPLIVRDPRPTADPARGAQVSALTESVDIMPTILAAVGLRAPRNCDGRDLGLLCSGPVPGDWRDAVFWSFDFRDIRTRRLERRFGLPSEWCHLDVVRTGHFKYVHFAGQPPVLFDLAAEPAELTNRAADPAARSLLLEGLNRLVTWRQRSELRTLTGFLARDGVLHDEDGSAAP